MRVSTIRKYRALQDRYRALYNIERRRIDDCIAIVAGEFFVSITTAQRVIVMELPQETTEQPQGEKCVVLA